MPIVAKDTRKEFTPAPEGLHQGVCVDVIDLGLMETQWGEKRQVDIRWQLDIADDTNGGKPFQVMKRYTLSLNEKASLRKHLEAWRGKKFTKEELEGFDLEKLLGKNCQIQVVHNASDNGNIWANVMAIVPLGKNMPKIEPTDYVRVKNRPENGRENDTWADPDDDPNFDEKGGAPF